MVGKQYEQGGIAKDGAKMVHAVSNANGPKFTVIFGGYSSSHNSAGKMKYGDVHYAGVSAEFRYSEGSYTCFLSGSYISSEDIQVIYDGFTK